METVGKYLDTIPVAYRRHINSDTLKRDPVGEVSRMVNSLDNRTKSRLDRVLGSALGTHGLHHSAGAFPNLTKSFDFVKKVYGGGRPLVNLSKPGRISIVFWIIFAVVICAFIYYRSRQSSDALDHPDGRIIHPNDSDDSDDSDDSEYKAPIDLDAMPHDLDYDPLGHRRPRPEPYLPRLRHSRLRHPRSCDFPYGNEENIDLDATCNEPYLDVICSDLASNGLKMFMTFYSADVGTLRHVLTDLDTRRRLNNTLEFFSPNSPEEKYLGPKYPGRYYTFTNPVERLVIRAARLAYRHARFRLPQLATDLKITEDIKQIISDVEKFYEGFKDHLLPESDGSDWNLGRIDPVADKIFSKGVQYASDGLGTQSDIDLIYGRKSRYIEVCNITKMLRYCLSFSGRMHDMIIYYMNEAQTVMDDHIAHMRRSRARNRTWDRKHYHVEEEDLDAFDCLAYIDQEYSTRVFFRHLALVWAEDVRNLVHTKLQVPDLENIIESYYSVDGYANLM